MISVNMSYGNSGENNIKVSIFLFPQGKLQDLCEHEHPDIASQSNCYLKKSCPISE